MKKNKKGSKESIAQKTNLTFSFSKLVYTSGLSQNKI